jgi:hypothetical protein
LLKMLMRLGNFEINQLLSEPAPHEKKLYFYSPLNSVFIVELRLN